MCNAWKNVKTMESVDYLAWESSLVEEFLNALD